MKEIVGFEGGRMVSLKLKESSLIREATYDKLTNQLTVKFYGGSDDTLYEYYGVPEQVVLDWEKARSSGSYFTQVIKNKFTTTKRTIVFQKSGNPAPKATTAVKTAKKGRKYARSRKKKS